MKIRSVAVILINYNGLADTLACLGSLRRMETENRSVSVIVVDNASTKGSPDVIAKKFPDVRLIRSRENLGFAAANNLAVRSLEETPDAVWFLNNDTVAGIRSLCLADCLEDARVGAAGSKIHFAAGHEYHRNRYAPEDRGRVIWYAGGLIDWDNVYASHRGVDEVDSGQYDTASETDFVTGCSFMLRTGTFLDTGGFDARYFLYLEDVDLSLRIRRLGLTLMYYPESSLWHVNASASGGPGSKTHAYYQTRNRLLVGMKYAPLRTRMALLRESVRMASGGDPAQRKALRDYYLGRFGKQDV